MKVLIINGSQRKAPGFTAALLGALAEGIVEAGGSSETVALAGLDMRSCIACEACQRTKSGVCSVAGADGTQGVFDAMREADAVVYASPVYVFAPSSLIKSLVERFYALGSESDYLVTRAGLFFHRVDKGVCGKPFVAVVTADNNERETTINSERWWRSFSRFLDAPLLGLLVRGGGRFIRSGKAAIALEEVLEDFRRAGRELVREGRVSRRTERSARRSALPLPRFALALLKTTAKGRAVLLERAKAGTTGQLS